MHTHEHHHRCGVRRRPAVVPPSASHSDPIATTALLLCLAMGGALLAAFPLPFPFPFPRSGTHPQSSLSPAAPASLFVAAHAWNRAAPSMRSVGAASAVAFPLRPLLQQSSHERFRAHWAALWNRTDECIAAHRDHDSDTTAGCSPRAAVPASARVIVFFGGYHTDDSSDAIGLQWALWPWTLADGRARFVSVPPPTHAPAPRNTHAAFRWSSPHSGTDAGSAEAASDSAGPASVRDRAIDRSSAASGSHYMVVFGGSDTAHRVFASLWILDVASLEWTAAGPMPIRMGDAAATVAPLSPQCHSDPFAGTVDECKRLESQQLQATSTPDGDGCPWPRYNMREGEHNTAAEQRSAASFQITEGRAHAIVRCVCVAGLRPLLLTAPARRTHWCPCQADSSGCCMAASPIPNKWLEVQTQQQRSPAVAGQVAHTGKM